jgi:hypothetical protein
MMESTLEKIERYRRLLRIVADERACKVLMELIAEEEVRLRAERARGAPSHDRAELAAGPDVWTAWPGHGTR